MKIFNRLLLLNFYEHFPERKLFCSIPFKYMEIGANDATLCCYLYKSPGKTQGVDFLELYNSPDAQEARKSILDGSFRYCDLDACPHYSSGDLPLQKDCAGTPYAEIIAKKQTSLEKKSVWIAFDARCNLRCFSCRKDYFKPTTEQICEIDRKMKVLKDQLLTIEHLGLTGNGDPFASPAIREFLFELNSKDYPNLKITILTNGLLFDEAAWNSMSKCRSAIGSVQVSVDAATSASYEKIRIGGSFEKLMDNLRFLSGLRKKNEIREFIISMVVNAINYKEMIDFVRLGESLACDQVYFSCMGNWGTLSASDYDNLAVHLPRHESHDDFKRILEDPILFHPDVFLGNMKRFQKRRILRESMFS